MDDDWLEERIGNYVQKYRKIRNLLRKRSPLQLIEVVETQEWGRMLLLDGAVQTTERDEFIYHEMIAHPPLLLHPSPKKVAIIGGGDGGVLRRCLEHPVEEVFLIEIDKDVIEVSKEFLPSISRDSFQDERAKVIVRDGFSFLGDNESKFDVVIVDSTDPQGEAEKLFSSAFYKLAYDSLEKDGILITQSGSLFYQPFLLKQVYDQLSRLFPKVAIVVMTVPTYPGVIWTATMGSKVYDPYALKEEEWWERARQRNLEIRYWDPSHQFLAPSSPFIAKLLKGENPFATSTS